MNNPSDELKQLVGELEAWPATGRGDGLDAGVVSKLMKRASKALVELHDRAAASAEPVAFVPLSKAVQTKGEPVWKETRPPGATGAWVGYELMPLYTHPAPAAASVREALEDLRDAVFDAGLHSLVRKEWEAARDVIAAMDKDSSGHE